MKYAEIELADFIELLNLDFILPNLEKSQQDRLI